MDKLKQLAPNVAFSVSRDIDTDEVWDGDGPDPRENGYDAYEIEVDDAALRLLQDEASTVDLAKQLIMVREYLKAERQLEYKRQFPNQ